MDKKIPLSDFERNNFNELKDHYKISDRQLEQQLRRHTRDANRSELQRIYNNMLKKD